jgi:preprotein translocase subunit YajC
MNPTIMFLFYGAIFAVVYFFFIRPQSQKAKDAKLFVDEIKKGDKVVTSSGIHAVVDEVADTTLMIRIDSHVRVKIEKSSISAEMSKAIQTTDAK